MGSVRRLQRTASATTLWVRLTPGRIRAKIADGSTLYTMDSEIHEIANVAGVTDQPSLMPTREAVEQTLNRLAAVSLGLPAGAAFAATLLIPREFMHHAGFEGIAVRG